MKIKNLSLQLILLTSLILLPRLWPFPPGFLTVDEVFTARWLTQMTRGVFTQDWVATANDTYPAVSLMWLEAAQVPLLHLTTGTSYDQLLSDDETLIFASIPRRRFTLGLINGLILLAAFGLLRQLFNETIALVATLLMALDPFMLTQSHVVRTEGLNLGLMWLSALTIMRYASTRDRRWLMVSAFLGGLATLTRFISIYLWPFAVLVLLIQTQQHRPKEQPYLTLGRSLFMDALSWLIIATLTFIILWPALWVAPIQTMAALYDHLARTAQGVDIVWHEGEFFYQGQLWRSNPGLGFYGWALAYRTTPFIWLGSLLLLFRLAQRRLESIFVTRIITLVAYISFYLIAMSLGESKLDRYLLPTFPAFALLAAIGFEYILTYLTQPRLALAVFLATHLAFTAYYQPYYFTYWNPLLGGATAAAKILPIGTGEGVDKMVSYLNTLPNAPQLKVASGQLTCRFAFKGTCLSSPDFLASDYSISFIAGIQRQQPLVDILRLIPDAELVTQYRHDGLDYAWLYRLPPGLHPVGEWLGEHGRLSGFRLQSAMPLPTNPNVVAHVGAGEALNLTLFWENGAQGWRLDDSQFFVTIRDSHQRHITTVSLDLQPSSQPYLRTAEQILAFTTLISLPQTLPLGEYHLDLGLRLLTTHETTWQFDLNNTPHKFLVMQGTTAPLHQTWPNVPPWGYEGLQLVGYEFKPDSEWRLYWQSEHPPSQNYRLNVTWLDKRGNPVIGWENTVAPAFHPLTTWQSGELVGLSLPLMTPADLPTGSYQPVLSLLAETDPITLATVTLPTQTITWTTPPVSRQHALDNLSFSQQLDLFGYDLHAKRDDKAGQLTVTLHWFNRYPQRPREVKLQLLDEMGQVMATDQALLPTSETWPIAPTTSQHVLQLTAPPAKLLIQTRLVGQTTWDTVYHANQPQGDTLTIDQLLTKIVVD